MFCPLAHVRKYQAFRTNSHLLSKNTIGGLWPSKWVWVQTSNFFCLSLSQFSHLVSSFNLFPKGSHCLCFLYESDLIFGSHHSCSAGKQSLYTLLDLASYHNSAFFLKFCFSLFFLVITFKLYSFSKCQLCSVVLSTILTSFRSSDLIYLTAGNSALNFSLTCLILRHWSLSLFCLGPDQE